jgi:hypothetical protein
MVLNVTQNTIIFLGILYRTNQMTSHEIGTLEAAISFPEPSILGKEREALG